MTDLYKEIDKKIKIEKVTCTQESLNLTCAEAYALISVIKINKIINDTKRTCTTEEPKQFILIQNNELDLKNTNKFIDSILLLQDKFKNLIDTYKNYKNLRENIIKQHAHILSCSQDQEKENNYKKIMNKLIKIKFSNKFKLLEKYIRQIMGKITLIINKSNPDTSELDNEIQRLKNTISYININSINRSSKEDMDKLINTQKLIEEQENKKKNIIESNNPKLLINNICINNNKKCKTNFFNLSNKKIKKNVDDICDYFNENKDTLLGVYYINYIQNIIN